MKLIAGLGNPGREYHRTRHNIGFEVIDELAKRGGITFESAPAEALIGRWRRADEAVLLVKPLTFMNNSGQAIGELARYFKIDTPDIFVILDEVQLPLGRLRARMTGSAGGHNGLKSVIAHLGSDIPRLRIGVDSMTARAADAAETFITSGIAAVMNGFNGGDPATTE